MRLICKFILIKFLQKASAVVRVAFLSSWSLENFGVDYYERGIEALASDTLVEILKVKVKPNQKSNDDEDDSAESDYDSDSEEKKIKKYRSKGHKDNEERTTKEIQTDHDNFP